ncbi:MAG TPA: hypothetical protein PK054_09225 [Anaerohalosphaeraceae bacterium]|nr:hypothetical protein [Anaerohalosphaeraceae bacterium]HOL89714.1 hypothetical protein [Anaerohalosphaeraceae bacterium]HPP56744.1 hypothetical protein [Anaerohalosphaeraceae bacterium]
MFCPKAILVCLLMLCLPATAASGAEVTFDADTVSHPFGGLGAQIWAGDNFIAPLLTSLKIRYVRLEATPDWASVSQTPPTDGFRSSFDQYVAANYGSARLSAMQNTCQLLRQLGIAAVFNQFHYPSAWRNVWGALEPEHHQDVALLWGAQLAYLRSYGIVPEYVDLFNEPEGTWNCRVPPEQYNDVLKRVRQELNERGFESVQIVGPGLAYLDHNGGGALWVGALDETAVASLGAFATHAWDEVYLQGCGPEFLRQRWQPFYAAVRAKDPMGQKPIFVTEYMTANRIFHGVEYPSPGSAYTYSASDTVPFAIRVFENTLSLLNGGASVPFVWEAADQSWSDSGWGLQRRAADGSVKRPVYYALRILTDLVPPGAQVLSAGPQEPGIYCAAFRYDNGIILAAVNGTESSQSRIVRLNSSQPKEWVCALSYSAEGIGDGSRFLRLTEPNVVELTLPSDTALTAAFEFSPNQPQKVLEWKFEGNLTDTSGWGNNATTAQGGFRFGKGRIGQALSLDGTEVLIELVNGANLPLNADDDWSMNLWVRPNAAISIGGDYHALALAAFGTNSWSKNGNARSIGNWGWGKGISFYSTTMVPTYANVPYDAGVWQMITITYEHALWRQQGTDTTGQALKIYKNGNLIASFNPQGRYYTGGFRTADNRVSILPAIPDLAPRRFAGKLDEFAIWRGVLSPAQILGMAVRQMPAADLSGDGEVDLNDLQVLCTYWLEEGSDYAADLNNDGIVNWEDFRVWSVWRNNPETF